MNLIREMLSYPFLVRALAGGMMVSLCASLLGVSLVLRRYSMIGDGLSHVSFGALSIALAMGWSPLRISIPVVVLAAFFLPGMDGVHGWRILMRDRHKHASPNSAQAEAACAGALHLRLAGDAWYFGILHKKPFIGDDDRPVCPMDIKRANRLMFAAEVILMAVLAAALFLA